MKAVVVEVREKFVAALTDDGCIIKSRNKNYVIGQVIEMKKAVHSYPKFIVCAASAAAVLAVGSGITAWAYNAPYTYVSLDVNPSIEYSVNVFDRVLSAEAVNDDGEAILENLDLENATIQDAVDATIQEITDAGYITSDELGGIVIATSSDDETKSEELAGELQEQAETTTEAEGVEAEVEVLSIGKERVEEARALGVTPGKLNLVEKLQASNPDEEIVIEDWLNKPVKSIMKAIKENKKAQEVTDVPAEETTTVTAVTDTTDVDVSETNTTEATALMAAQEQKAVTTQQEKIKNNPKATETAVPATAAETSVQTGQAPETAQTQVTTEKQNNKPSETGVTTEKVKENNGSSNSNSNNSNGSNSNSKSEKSNNEKSNSGKSNKK